MASISYESITEFQLHKKIKNLTKYNKQLDIYINSPKFLLLVISVFVRVCIYGSKCLFVDNLIIIVIGDSFIFVIYPGYYWRLTI